MEKKTGFLHWFIICTFSLLYLFVSVISMIHVVDFFELSNAMWLSITLAVAFELGAAASLASVIIVDRMNKFIVWTLFIILTCFQMMGNAYYAYAHLHDFNGWIELFGLIDLSEIEQKRILAIVSGAILPIVALGFIKCLVDYLKPKQITNGPEETEQLELPHDNNDENVTEPIHIVTTPEAEMKETIEDKSEAPKEEVPQTYNEYFVPEEDKNKISYYKENENQKQEEDENIVIEGSPRDVIDVNSVDEEKPVKRTSLFRRRH